MRIALDDFGTGYSTLAHLRKLAVDKIKIDRTFVKSIGQVGDADAIIRALIQLGNNLGVETSAEGVETEEQRQLLRELGCTELQGFLIAWPKPIAEIECSLNGETRKLASWSWQARAHGHSRFTPQSTFPPCRFGGGMVS